MPQEEKNDKVVTPGNHHAGESSLDLPDNLIDFNGRVRIELTEKCTLEG